MTKSKNKGKKGEDLVCNHLITRGYTILYRNWRFGKNEIDIIAQKENFIVFIEVKYRTNTNYLPLEETVAPSQQKKIIKAANAFLNRFEEDVEARFDIFIIIENEHMPPSFNYWENAFYDEFD